MRSPPPQRNIKKCLIIFMRYQTPFIVFKKKNQNMWFIKTLNNNHKYNHVMTNTDNVFDWKCY